jgi:hypothetical protein
MKVGKMNLNSIDRWERRCLKLALLFFDSEVLDAHARMIGTDVWFAHSANSNLESYWESATPSSQFKIETIALENLEDSILSLWAAEPLLGPMALSLAELARQIKRDDAHEDLSPFIYAMF